jgi:hypothetical protein
MIKINRELNPRNIYQFSQLSLGVTFRFCKHSSDIRYINIKSGEDTYIVINETRLQLLINNKQSLSGGIGIHNRLKICRS